jgi:uncharacterized membrane protein (UPF0136 family)
MTVEATQDVQDHNRGQDSRGQYRRGLDNRGEDGSGPIVKIGRKEFPLARAEANCRRQAAGFYWIAGLSLVNMISLAGRWDFSMYLGLGVTEILQAAAMVASRAQEDGLTVGLYAATLAVIAMFAVFGWRARQIERWPFILGMSLYAVDSVIFLVFQDFFAFGFHIFWLVFLWMGLIWVKPVQDARRRLVLAGRPDGASETAKLPDFLHAENRVTAPAD